MDALSLVPPLVAIILAFATKRVLLSLFVALMCAEFIIADYHVTTALWDALERFEKLFTQAWIIYALFFSLLVGSIMRLLEFSGGIYGFIDYLTNRHKVVKSKRGALFLGMITGVVIFIESSLTALIVATVSKPFAKTYNISKEKIAYLCDTTASPMCSLVPLNGWGVLLIGLITTSIATLGLENVSAVEVLIYSIGFNFYAYVSLIVLAIVIYKDINVFSMKNIVTPYVHHIDEEHKPNRCKRDFIIPILSLLVLLFVSLYFTSWDEKTMSYNLMKGDGSKSLFIAVIGTLGISYLLYVNFGHMKDKEFIDTTWQGIFDLAPVVAILLFAFTFAGALSELKTAQYLGSLVSDNISVIFIPALIFLLSGVMAFATGTSWGTFSIMIPISVATIDPSVIPLAMIIGAVVSGAVFGDHTSPISDTTILSSLAAEVDHMNHVKTQLPYALFSGIVSLIMFFIVTWFYVS
jgi:tetracycline resistance efflux pump